MSCARHCCILFACVSVGCVFVDGMVFDLIVGVVVAVDFLVPLLL